MRIAQIAPLTESVPPRQYGGIERVVSFLTEQLVAMGHDVTLFASGDSVTRAMLVAGWPRALRRTVRRTALPHRLLALFSVQPTINAISHHVAWPARPTGAGADLRELSARASSVDL